MRKKKSPAPSGNRTRVYCLGSNNANHYTNSAAASQNRAWYQVLSVMTTFFPRWMIQKCKNTVAYRSAVHLSKRYPRRDSNPQSLAPETNALSIRPRGQLKRARRLSNLPGALQEQQAATCKAVGWPSGLRRQFQALVSSEAWVRIPLQSFLLLPKLFTASEIFFGYRICLVPATVQLWSSWL